MEVTNLQNAYQMVLFLRNVFYALNMFFGKKTQKTSRVGKVKKYEVFFLRKTFSSFKIASLPYWEGAKYAGGSRPSCFSAFQISGILYENLPFSMKATFH